MTCCGSGLKAADLNRQIEVLRRSETPDGMGGISETWATVATLWAKVSPVSASERAYAGRIEAMADFKMVVRFAGDADHNPIYTPDDRIRYQAKIYGIVGVVDVKAARQWLEISVRAAK